MLALPPTGGNFGLSPELAQLAQMDDSQAVANAAGQALLQSETKTRLVLLITRLAPSVEEKHVEEILSTCGEVHAWRRGLGANNEKLSFGFVQFGDAEAAWKAS